MIYWIIGLVALAGIAAWLIWRNAGLRRRLAQLNERCRELQSERGQRQNLQRICDRREAEIRRLRAKVADYEADFEEMESRASDLNMSLFRESGLRILAEKEDGAKRLKMEQLEQQVSDWRRKLREQQAEAAETVRRMQDLIDRQEKEIARLQQLNARRIKRTPVDPAITNQVTLDDVLGGNGAEK